jgi:Na+/proline symporter
VRGQYGEQAVRADGRGGECALSPRRLTCFVTDTFGLLITHVIWRWVVTARSPAVARGAGAASGGYCLLRALVGAVIGMAAKVPVPALNSRDDDMAQLVRYSCRRYRGLVLAASLAAVMSISSGALIASAQTSARSPQWLSVWAQPRRANGPNK